MTRASKGNVPPVLGFVLIVERSVRDAIAEVLISASHCLCYALGIDRIAVELRGWVVQRAALASNAKEKN